MGNIRRKDILAVILGITVIGLFLATQVQSAEFCASDATELQNHLNTAATNGENDVIKVVQGSYLGNFSYSSSQGYNITLEGGYTSGCSNRMLDPANTVLDGNNTDRVLNIENTGNGGDISIEGFTIQNGYGTGQGGGVYTYTYSDSGTAGNITIERSILTGNTCLEGCGAYVQSRTNTGTTGDITLADVTITGNTSHDDSAGAYIRVYTYSTGNAGNVLLTDSIITGNTSYGYYGGAYIQTSSSQGTVGDITLTGNTISENTAYSYCGGVSAYSYTDSGPTAGSISLSDNNISGNLSYGRYGGAYLNSYAYAPSPISGMTRSRPRPRCASSMR